MKLIAYIMVFGIGMLGMNRFMIDTGVVSQETELTGCMSCCDSESNSTASDCGHGNDAAAEEEGKDLTHACPNGCDCSCCYHIMAITYYFISVPSAAVQTYHYGGYVNDYHFEFKTPLFEPPRFG